MNGVLKEVAQTLKGRIIVAKVDVVLHPGLATRYNVGGLPTLLVMKGGTEVGRQVGSLGHDDLVRFVEGSLRQVEST